MPEAATAEPRGVVESPSEGCEIGLLGPGPLTR